MDSTIKDLGKVFTVMRDDLINKGKLLSFYGPNSVSNVNSLPRIIIGIVIITIGFIKEIINLYLKRRFYLRFFSVRAMI